MVQVIGSTSFHPSHLVTTVIFDYALFFLLFLFVCFVLVTCLFVFLNGHRSVKMIDECLQGDLFKVCVYASASTSSGVAVKEETR